MPGCFEVVNGYLQYVGAFSDACAGFAVVTADDYRNAPTFEALFTVPESEAISSAFIAGLSLPLILWLSAWGFGVVVNFINHRSDQPTYEE